MPKTVKKGNTISVKLDCDLISTTVEELKNEFRKILENEKIKLSLDMKGVKVIDSLGLGLLIATHNSLQKSGKQLQLSHVSDVIAGLLDKMNLDMHFVIN